MILAKTKKRRKRWRIFCSKECLGTVPWLDGVSGKDLYIYIDESIFNLHVLADCVYRWSLLL